MGIKVLGPLEVDGVGGNVVTLGPRDRVVLEALALELGGVVARDRLADALWGDDVPRTWPKVVQGCVVRLRKLLGSAAVETSDVGYRLTLGDDDLDSVVFERLVERGRGFAVTGEMDRAASAFARALSLWRGPAFSDLSHWPRGRAEAARLDEVRRSVEEDLLDARLAAGEHRAIVAEAEARVAEEPLRERRWAILVLAQYRCARQGDALGSLRRARQTLVEALGIDPGPELVALEQAVLRQDPELRPSPPAAEPAVECPYKGLASYEVGDAESFFGRNAQVATCVERLASTQLVAVTGPSGCGKSSLLQAGVVPALRGSGRAVAVFSPGSDAEAAMVAALTSTPEPAVLVVDQFEDLFTHATSSHAAAAFCARLATYAHDTAPVIVAVRADHLAHMVADDDFARLVERGLQLLKPLSGDDLRQAIEGPAIQAGLRLEHGLVDLLMRDAEGEPGALPLLSHTLAETWRRRDGRVLTVEGYRATGGIRGAVARSADELYESLPADQRSTMRSILLRLVTPAIDGEPVRSRVPIHCLADDPTLHGIVDHLVRARLVTTDEHSVELAHEALARAWPRLRSWLEDDAAGQRILRHVSAAAAGWESLGRPHSELYRGARLDAALEWRDATRPDLTPLESDFLDASLRYASSERAALQARARRQARQNRELRVLLGAVAALLVASVVAGLDAFGQRDRARQAAAVADTAAGVADARRLSALSLTVDDLDQALLLAVEGRQLHDSDDTRTNLMAALNRRPQAIGVLRHPVLTTYGEVAVTGDGRFLAAHNVGDLAFFDTATLRAVAEATGPATIKAAMTPMADGRAVAVVVYTPDEEGLGPGKVVFVDPSTGAETRHPLGGVPDPPGSQTGATSIATSRDGRYVAVAIPENPDTRDPAHELIWDLKAPQSPPRRVTHGAGGPSLAFTPAGALAVVDDQAESALTLLDPATGEVGATIPGARAPIAVSPDDELAFRHGDALVTLDVETGERRVVTTTAAPTALAYSANGQFLVSGNSDRTIEIWDAATGKRIDELAGHTAPATTIAFGPDSTTLLSSSADGTVIAWDLNGDRRVVSQLAPPDHTPNSLKTRVVPNPNGTKLSYLYGDQLGDDHFAVRDLATARMTPQRTTLHPYAGWHDWTPDGQRLVTVGDDRDARLWEPDTGRLLAEHRLPLDSTSASIAWQPNGDTIFLGLHAGGIVELDAHTLEVVEKPLQLDRYVSNVAVSPDGTLLAVELFEPDELLLLHRETHHVIASFDDVDAHWQLKFSLDGSLLAAGGTNGVVTLIDTATRRIVPATLRGVDGPVASLMFSPDSSRLVTSSTDGTVQIWDVSTHQRLARITPGTPHQQIYAWFTDNGRTIIAADERGGIWRIPTEPAEWERRACQIAGRNLTREEWTQLLPDRPYHTTCSTHLARH